MLYSPKSSSEAVSVSDTDKADQFRREALKRKKVFLFTWFAWLIVAPALVVVYSWVIPSENPQTSVHASMITYGLIWFWADWRFTSMKCFHCGKKAFDHINVFKRREKCKYCGTSFIAKSVS